MSKSRLELRKMNEAAEASEPVDETEEAASPKKKPRKTAKRKASSRRSREKPPERKRAVWMIYSSSMKEEGRFPYDQKEAAEERLATLQGKGKKVYFMQMVKELITGTGEVVPPVAPVAEADEETKVVTPKASEDEEETRDELGDVEVDENDFEDDEEEEVEEEESIEDED